MKLASAKPESITRGRPGQPTKYTPATIDLLLKALAGGLNVGQACKVVGVGQSTLSDWKTRHPELPERLEAAREACRARALAQIQAAGADDWRAASDFLKYSFWQDYRPNSQVNVNASATVQQATVVSEEQRARLIAVREQITGKAFETPARSLDRPLVAEPVAVAPETESRREKQRELEIDGAKLAEQLERNRQDRITTAKDVLESQMDAAESSNADSGEQWGRADVPGLENKR